MLGTKSVQTCQYKMKLVLTFDKKYLDISVNMYVITFWLRHMSDQTGNCMETSAHVKNLGLF